MIEHDALCACGDQRFRQNVGKAAARLQRVHVRGKDVDMLGGGFDRADRNDRRGKNDIDAVFLRGFVGSDGKVDNVLPVEVGFRPDLKNGARMVCWFIRSPHFLR